MRLGGGVFDISVNPPVGNLVIGPSDVLILWCEIGVCGGEFNALYSGIALPLRRVVPAGLRVVADGLAVSSVGLVADFSDLKCGEF